MRTFSIYSHHESHTFIIGKSAFCVRVSAVGITLFIGLGGSYCFHRCGLALMAAAAGPTRPALPC